MCFLASNSLCVFENTSQETHSLSIKISILVLFGFNQLDHIKTKKRFKAWGLRILVPQQAHRYKTTFGLPFE